MGRIFGMMALAALFACAGCDWGREADDPVVPTIDRVGLSFEWIGEPGEPRSIIAARTGGGFAARDTLSLMPGAYRVFLHLYEDGESVMQYLVEQPEEPVLRYALNGGLSARVRLDDLFPKMVPLEDEASSAPYGAKTSPLPAPGFFARVDTTTAEGALHLVLERYDDFPPQGERAAPLGTDFDVRFPLRIAADSVR